MTQWDKYRMWRRVMNAVAVGGSSGEWLGEWRPTEITFPARSQAEAQKKAEKFWRDAKLGMGSMVCIFDGTQPGVRE
jgi:hypothetical protein